MINFPDIQAKTEFLYQLNGVEVSILREDLLHPLISGNKIRKLKYNLESFESGNYDALLTFGGAYSNHIFAVAAAGKEFGFKTIGIIRGEELASKVNENPSLSSAKECGMQLEFISREKYRLKIQTEFLDELKNEFGNIFIVPEGGTNEYAVKGCEEILGKHTEKYDFICCAAGTGGTVSGIINTTENHQKVLVFPALKDSEYLTDEIKRYIIRSNYEWINDYHFGGFAKVSDELITFMNRFKEKYGVNLDPVYTSKMMFGIEDLILKNHFKKGSKILAVHTGGLQGIEGMNKKLKQKNKKEIK